MKNESKLRSFWSAGESTVRAMGTRTLVELRLLHVLEHHALAALLGDDALVVGQVVGRGLTPCCAVAGGDRLRSPRGSASQRAQLRIAELRDRSGRLFSISCRCCAKKPSFGGLFVVAQIDVGFERGLVAEELVVVGLVGTDRDVERRVEVHPGDVAVVVIVGEERVGARGQEFFEGRVVGERGGFAQKSGSLGQVVFVRLTVGNDDQLFVCVAVDDAVKARRDLLIFFGQCLKPSLELRLGHVGGIEICAQRLALGNIGKECIVAVQIGPWAFVLPEIFQPRTAERRLSFFSFS